MSNLTLGDLKAGLKDLLGPRLVHLQPTAAHAMYGPMLSARLAEIEALPAALTGNKPNAVALAETDDRHDGYGMALWHLGQAILKHPEWRPELASSTSERKNARAQGRKDARDQQAGFNPFLAPAHRSS